MPIPPDPDAAVHGVAEALARLAAGDEDAWRRVHDLLRDDLAAAATRICGAELAADAVQESLLQVRRSAARFAPREGIPADVAARGWVLRIVAHTALKLVRTQTRAHARDRRGEALAAPRRPDEALERDETAALVRRELARLPDGTASPILLHHVAGLSFDEIAAELRVPVGTAKARACRGIRVLRRRLERLGLASPAVVVGILGEEAGRQFQAAGAASAWTATMLTVAAVAVAGAATAAALRVRRPSSPPVTPATAAAAVDTTKPATRQRRVLRVGAGGEFATLAALPALASGDIIELLPGTHRGGARLVGSADGEPIVLRGLASDGGSAPVVDGKGVALDGDGGHPRALIELTGGRWRIEGIACTDAANDEHNAAALRFDGVAEAVVSGSIVTGCDIGVQAHDGGTLTLEDARVERCGRDPGRGYAPGVMADRIARLSVLRCDLRGSLDGPNLWSNARWVEIEGCLIAGAAGAQIDLAASGLPAAGCDALITGTLIDARGTALAHAITAGDGPIRLRLAFDTIDVGGRPSALRLGGAETTATADSCVFLACAALASGPGQLRGDHDWIPPTARGSAIRGVPGADALLDAEYRPLPGSPCVDAGAAVPAWAGPDGARSSSPRWEPPRDAAARERMLHGAPDLGAFER